MNKQHRKIGLLFILVFALTLTAGFFAFAFADDPSTPVPAADITAIGAVVPAAAMLPAHTVAATAPAAMPSLQALPATKTPMSLLLWVIGALFPWLGWLASELLPFLPGKVNGIMQGILLFIKAFSTGPDNSVTLQLAEMQSAIADLKGQIPTSPGTGGA